MTTLALYRSFANKERRIIASSRVFFGWLVVAAATIGMAMTIPGQTAGVSLFIDWFIADLGITRSTVALVYTLATVVGSVALPFIGRWTDRYGPRRAVLVVSLLFGLSCMFMGLVGGLVTLAIGFVLIRGLGQGGLSLVSLHAVNLWFVRRRGTAIGIMGVGIALSMAFFPMLAESLIAQLGWRMAFVVIGGGVLAVMLPVGLFLYHPQPERYGLLPDGDKPVDGAETVREIVLTLAQARRTAIFWILTMGLFCIGALGTGLIFHHFSILATNGVDRAAAALIFLPMGLMTAVTNVGTGVMIDRVGPRVPLATMLLVFAVMLLAVPFVAHPIALWGYGIIFGLVSGMQGAILGSAYAYYFGRAHIGAIKGFIKTFIIAGTAVGPLVYAVGYDILGSYQIPLAASAILPVAVGVATLGMKAPVSKASPGEGAES